MYKFGFDRPITAAEPAFTRISGSPMQRLKSEQPDRMHHPVEKKSGLNLHGPSGNPTDERWRMEQLEKLVREKDILLNELQHRVKNDLNIILSLINLEMEKIHEDGLRQILIDLKTRINTIASVYRQLSPSNITGIVDLRSHIRNIVESLFNTFAADNGKLAIKTDLKEIKVDFKNAALLGLMVNELATNAIKYALQNAEKGEIRIQMQKSSDMITI